MEIMLFIVPVFAIGIIIFTFAMFLSPKLRGKMMAKQMQSLKHMVNATQDDMAELSSAMVKTSKKIIDNNEEDLKHISRKKAEINSEALETTARAIKKGFTEEKIYCKYCGTSIDKDSVFCKNCGQKQ